MAVCSLYKLAMKGKINSQLIINEIILTGFSHFTPLAALLEQNADSATVTTDGLQCHKCMSTICLPIPIMCLFSLLFAVLLGHVLSELTSVLQFQTLCAISYP